MNDTAENKAPTMQDIEKKLFAPDAMEKAQAYLTSVVAICTAENVNPVWNFDPQEDFPAGYNLAIIPITERVAERGNVTRGVLVAAVPTIAAIMADASGESFVTKQITDNLVRQVSAAAKAKDGITSLPFKVGDFTTSSRSSGLLAFNTLAGIYVKALRAKGLKFMSKLLLRQTLTSSTLAEQQFPRIEQSNWEIVLRSMIAHATKESIEVGNLQQWLETRDTIEVELADIDLSDIDGLLPSDEEEAAAV